MDQNGVKRSAPEFLNKGAKNYRFDLESNTLEKKCIQCHSYYVTQKLEDDQFFDIHDEDEIHYISSSSGYNGRCKKCLHEHPAEVGQTQYDLTDGSNEYQLSAEANKYIFQVAIEKGLTKEDSLESIVLLVKKHNPVIYTEKIK